MSNNDDYFDFLAYIMAQNPYPKEGWRALYLATQMALSLSYTIWRE